MQCDRGNRFGVGNATWKTKTTTEGALKTEAGRICTTAAITDATAKLWAARLRSASVTPRGKISDAYQSLVKASWVKAPFNVRVADAALDGGALEDVLAGMGYRDSAHRRGLLNLIGWFPGLCGDRATGDTRPWKAACRADVAAAVTFALMGEPDEAQWRREKVVFKIKSEAMWWQTAFRTPVDGNCDLARQKTGGTDPPVCKAGVVKDLKTGGAHDGKKSVALTAAALYYGRGAGPVRLTGPADYSAFSKAVLGTEEVFGLAPEKVLAYGAKMGIWHG